MRRPALPLTNDFSKLVQFALLDGSIFPARGVQEPDDFLHDPDPRRDKYIDNGGTLFTARGIANLGCLAIIALGILTLLCVALPCFASGSSLTVV